VPCRTHQRGQIQFFITKEAEKNEKYIFRQVEKATSYVRYTAGFDSLRHLG
jgi:hypothetical protein